mgnify:FL=1
MWQQSTRSEPLRYLRFSIFLSAIVIVTSVFLPFLQLGIGGMALGHRSTLPLYGAVNDYTFVEGLVAKADASGAERIADALLARLGRAPLPIASELAKAKAALDDAKELRNQADMEQFGTILRSAGLAFLGILAIVAWLVLKSMSQKKVIARRSIWIAVLMTLAGALSIGLFVASQEAIVLANAEIGTALISSAIGAYMMLVGGITGFLAALASAVLDVRKSRGAP